MVALASVKPCYNGADYGPSQIIVPLFATKPLVITSPTIFTIYVVDTETGISIYQCETTNEQQAQNEVDRLNGYLARTGRPCTAHYIP